MKIGIDARILGTGGTGIGRYTEHLISELVQLDPDDEFVLFLAPGNHDHSFLFPNVKKIIVNAPHYSLAEQTTFWRALQKEKLDLMHFTHFNAPLFYHGRAIVTIHDLTLHLFPGLYKNRWYHRLAYRLIIRHITKIATRIIAVSQHTKQDIIKYLKQPADKITVIHEAVDPNPPDSLDIKRWKITQPYLLYVGVFRNHKNIDGLIKAFALLKKQTNLPHQLVLAGSKSADYESLLKLIQKLNLEQAVIFTDRVNDQELFSLLEQATLFVFPSFYEGFGLPPLEAMLVGTPCVVANTSSIPEVCGNAAEYFNPHDIYDLAHHLKVVLTNQDRQQELITLGHQQVQKYSWSRMAKETLSLYQSLLHG